MAFTAEQRQKALDTRKRNKEQRELVKQNEFAGTATTAIAVGEESTEENSIKFSQAAIEGDPEKFPIVIDGHKFDWMNSTIGEAVDCLSIMKQQYDRAASIVLSRQSKVPTVWKCWTQNNKQLSSKTAIAQCKGSIPDGKWVFKDDGAKDEEGNIAPIVCCSQMCFMGYTQRPRNLSALSRH